MDYIPSPKEGLRLNHFLKYVTDNLNVSVFKETGIVFAKFIVEKDGTISNVGVIKPADEPAITKEIARALESYPKWH